MKTTTRCIEDVPYVKQARKTFADMLTDKVLEEIDKAFFHELNKSKPDQQEKDSIYNGKEKKEQ